MPQNLESSWDGKVAPCLTLALPTAAAVLKKTFEPVEIAEFLPLSPVACEILLALADGELHGYAIKREVFRRTDGRTEFSPGTLYGALERLVTRGLIEETASRPDRRLDDPRRRYYRLRPAGHAVMLAEIERLESLICQARAKALFALPAKQ